MTVVLQCKAPLPTYHAKRRFIFKHAERDWFLPGVDVAYETMEELKQSSQERTQICKWMLQYNHLRESFRDLGVSFFDTSKGPLQNRVT